MAASIRIEDAALRAGLADLQAKLGRMKPALNDIGEALLNSTRERFRSETDPDGNKWRPLSPAYARKKALKGNSKTILQLRGYLFGSLTYQATDTVLEIGSNRDYAAIHQFGGVITRPAGSGSVRLRTDRRGNLIRRGNLAVFASRRQKLATVREFVRGPSVARIPARPFLGLSTADRSTALQIVSDYLSPG